ncbi:MAG: ankyrin repeat domain-containing protein [Bacteroidia bacterium]|nr:ankyrin repeat domain-containing protein [Bacteroidia bacterium]
MDKLMQLLQERDHKKISKYLYDHPVVLDEVDQTGVTGYLQILYHRIPEVIALAKKLKVNYNYYEAIASGMVDQVKTNIDDNENLVEQLSPDGFTPIGLATFFSQNEIAKLLFEYGADPSTCADNFMKVNAMHAAAGTGNIELLKLFLEKGYDPNIPQMNNITPIQSAAHRGDLEMVKLLVEYGADPKIKSTDKFNAISYAREGGFDEIVAYLKKHKRANVDK